jgi:hypothetical protein
MADPDFDPRMPVRDLMDRFPAARSVFTSFGLESCCGGEHALEQACAARGVPLEKVLADLRSAHAAAEAHSIVPPTMTVREVRTRFPSTRPVLERYGLGDCGGEEGPDEPLAWFATVHRLPLEEFLRDVRAAAVRDAASRPRESLPAAGKLPFFPGFILGALGLTLTLGATTGMINLFRIAAGGDVPFSHRQIHGHTQILGFAGLFLMGIAFHALPRILGIAGFRAAGSRAAFWLMFLGVILRNVGQPLAFYPAGRLLCLIATGMEVASGVLFAVFVFSALRALREGKYTRGDPLLRFVGAGTLYFLLAMLVLAAQGIWLAGHFETALPAWLTEPFYFFSLYGFLLAWIFGFGNRVVSLFLGIGPARRATPEAALAAQAAGVLLYGAAWLPGISGGMAGWLKDGGMLMAALSAIVYLGGHGFLWRSGGLPVMRTPGKPTFAIRAAFACLGAWALLQIAGIALSRFSAFPAQNPWWNDAARHLFTVGFLNLIIVGMSFRILPVFSGKTLWSPRMAYATYGLILVASALRLLQYPAAFRPALYGVGAWSGVAVVLGLVLFTFNLMRTMRGGARPSAPSPSARRAAPDRPAFLSTLPVR